MPSNILQFRDKADERRFSISSVIAKLNQLNLFSSPRLVNTVLVLAAGLLFIGLFYITYRTLINPLINLINLFIGAWLIALVLEPLVRRLVRWGLPKIIAILITYLVTLAVLAALLTLIVTELYGLVNDTLNNSSGTVKNNINNLVHTFGVSDFDCSKVEPEITKMVNKATSQPFNLVLAVGFAIVQVILTIIISITFLAGKEYSPMPVIRRSRNNLSIVELLPARTKRYCSFIYHTIEEGFKGYLLGRVEIALVYGALVWVVMFLAGIDCPVATASLCALILIIPVVGAPISLFLPAAVALMGDNKPVLVVLLALFIIQTLLLNAVLPKWLKRSSGSGPVATLFILLAGAQLGGVFGIMVAVPLVGAIKKISIVTFKLRNQTKRSV